MEKFLSQKNFNDFEILKQKDINLWDVRIFQKNTLFITGLPKSLANKELLEQNSFLGQYGNIEYVMIKKVEIKKFQKDNFSFYQTHVKYSSEYESSKALVCLDMLKINDRQVKVFYGMSRYCSKLLNNEDCLNEKCPYIHQFNKNKDWFLKGDNVKKLYFLNYNKMQIIQKLLFDQQQARINFFRKNNTKSVFPTVSSLLKQYCVVSFSKNQEINQIQFKKDLFKQFEIDCLRDKLCFRKMKIQQKTKSLEESMKNYLDKARREMIFLNLNQNICKNNILIEKKIFNTILKKNLLNFELYLLKYVFKKLNNKKFQTKVFKMYKKVLKRHLKQNIDTKSFIIQYAQYVYLFYEKKNHAELSKVFYLQTQTFNKQFFSQYQKFEKKGFFCQINFMTQKLLILVLNFQKLKILSYFIFIIQIHPKQTQNFFLFNFFFTGL